MKVILAEDDEPQRKSLAKLLRRQGHEVIDVDDGDKVLDAAADNPDVDIILTDIQMPHLNGVSVVNIIKTFTELDVPIIAITGLTPEQYPAEPFDKVIEKPIKMEKLVETMEDPNVRH